MLVVGPVCVLTHGTAALSFLALQFSDSDLIRTFGEAGLMATVIALDRRLSLVPVFGVLLVRKENLLATKVKVRDRGVEALRAFCALSPSGWSAVPVFFQPDCARGVRSRHYLCELGRYRLTDQVPTSSRSKLPALDAN